MAQSLFTICTGTSPQQVQTTAQTFSSATFFGYSGFNSSNGTPQNNSGVVNVGIASGQLPIVVPTGGSVTFSVANDGRTDRESLSNLWIRGGRSGDGVFILFS